MATKMKRNDILNIASYRYPVTSNETRFRKWCKQKSI